MISTIFIFLTTFFTIIVLSSATNSSNLKDFEEEIGFNNGSKILSRRKRFIIFPDGSSFQFVFCTQSQGYIQVGDIVWLGNTAALAWELPSDPKLFYFLKDHKGYEAQRRNDVNNKHIYYLDEGGKVFAKVPYKRKILVNPAFAKRSVDHAPKENKQEDLMKPVPIEKMHDKQLRRVLKKELENVQFHREGRRGLYEKLESFIESLGWKGRECVLRLLCEAGQDKTKQGTFVDEIMKAVFTLPQGQSFDLPHHQAYDEAHQGTDCVQSYPDCVEKISGKPLL